MFHTGNGGSTPTSALQLLVRKCDVHLACALNALWHSRLPHIHWSNIVRARMSDCFVAEYEGRYYACAIWSSPVARLLNGRNWYELRRLAIAPDAPANTASRLLRVMRLMIQKERPEIVKLISYQDTQVHAGIIYRAAGWVPTVRNKDGNWSRPNRKRNVAQSLSPKLRWEYDMVRLQ